MSMIDNIIKKRKTADFIKAFKEKIQSSPLLYRLAKGTFWLLIGTIASRVFSLVSTIVIARILGKEDFGAYGMVQSTLGMFGLFAGFAMGSTMTKYLAEFRTKNPQRAGRILSLTKTLAVLSSGLISVILIFVSPWLAESTLKRPDLSPILITGTVFLFVSTLNNVQVGALAGFEAFKETARINFFQGIATPLVAIPLVYLYGLQGAIVALIIISILGYILCSITLKKECLRYGISYHHFDPAALKEWEILLKFSFPATMSGLLVIPVTWITNTILINQQNGYAELGLFNAANQWSQFIIFIPQILASVMLPIFSETHGREDKMDFLNAFEMNFRFTWTVALPITIVVITFRDNLSALFGSQYSGTASIITLLMITAFFNIINNVVGTALAGAGRMWAGAIFNFAWAIVLVIATMLLVPIYGGFGLAMAYLLAYFLHTIWQMVYTGMKLVTPSILANYTLVIITIVTLFSVCFLEYLNIKSVLFNVIIIIIASFPLYRVGVKILF